MKLIVFVLLVTLSQPVSKNGNKPITFFEAKELKCLVDNIYHEARGESLRGQVAVAKVTLNRAKDSSICTEVYKYKQFSWTFKKVEQVVPDYTSYIAAHLALKSNFPATHYHAISVKPVWAKSLNKLITIENHVFYIDKR